MKHEPITLVLILLAAGCGGDDAGMPDATLAPDAPVTLDGPSAFACAGQTLPTTAPDPVTVSGKTIDIVTSAPIPSVTVSAFRTGNATAFATTTSDGSADFSISAATGGTPIDGYLQASITGYRDTYLYSAVPIATTAAGVEISLITQQDLDASTTAIGITQSAASGAMLVRVTDCNGATLAGATISTVPAGEIRYEANSAPSTTATMTDASGIAFIYNVPPGSVTVDARLGSLQLRTRVVAVHAGAGTITGLRP